MFPFCIDIYLDWDYSQICLECSLTRERSFEFMIYGGVESDKQILLRCCHLKTHLYSEWLDYWLCTLCLFFILVTLIFFFFFFFFYIYVYLFFKISVSALSIQVNAIVNYSSGHHPHPPHHHHRHSSVVDRALKSNCQPDIPAPLKYGVLRVQ